MQDENLHETSAGWDPGHPMLKHIHVTSKRNTRYIDHIAYLRYVSSNKNTCGNL